MTLTQKPALFRRMSFLRLTPTKYQFGEVDRNGGISTQGNRMTRTLIYEVAIRLLTRYGTNVIHEVVNKNWPRL
ncbi:IS110 family transposase (plasmid) [Rahnella aquatilis]|nr:IS110 family transposase [Rahnella aquatilis]